MSIPKCWQSLSLSWHCWHCHIWYLHAVSHDRAACWSVSQDQNSESTRSPKWAISNWNLIEKCCFWELRKATYPPWARSPPQIKRRTPQLVNPTQPRRVLSTILFSCASAFVFVQQLHQHCIAWCFLIHLTGVCLVHLLNFKTPKPKKNIISQMMDF